MAVFGLVTLNLLGPGISFSRGLAITELAPNACLGHRSSFLAGRLLTTPCTGGQHAGMRRRNDGKLWAAPSQSVDACRRVEAFNLEDGDSAKLVQSSEDASARGREIEQQERQIGRRYAVTTILLLCSAPIVVTQMPGKLFAEEAKKEAENSDQSPLGGLLSLFDPNETTKQGKKLPKAYLKSAREVVQTLRASFSEDSPNDAKFRRNADSAKGAIREYISNWRGAKLVDAEDSYQALEKVLRRLSEFYSKKGPSAVLPEDVRARILEDLQTADDAL